MRLINYYDKVTACINLALKNCIPAEPRKTRDFIEPSWTDYVQEKHNLSRQAFIDRVSAGKPRQGHEVICTRKTTAAFKLAIHCRQREDQMHADACANSLESKDPRKFWNSNYKISKKQSY